MIKTIISELLVLALVSKKPVQTERTAGKIVAHASPRPAPGIQGVAAIKIEVEATAAQTIAKKKAPVDIRTMIDQYATQYRVDASKMKNIARCESGFRPKALSSSGTYGGMYQFVASTWVANRMAMGVDPNPALRFNAEESIKTAAFKMSRDGYGAWPVCGRI